MRNLANWYLRLAVLYLVAGVALGIGMAASHDHTMHPVHAHLNLLGWVTMGLFGMFLRAWPEAATTRLAQAQFWLYVPAHFVMMVSLAALYRGATWIEPLLAAMSVIVGLGILCFTVLVWKHTAAERTPAAAAGATKHQPA